MPSIKQVIAEIQLAPIPDHHKRYIAKQIEEALQRLSLKLTSKTRKVSNAKGLTTLPVWEGFNGILTAHDIGSWIEQRQLCRRMVGQMILEFRDEMLAKGKQYANFKMAFQTYLTKGYLSKKLSDCSLANSPSNHQTVIHTKGGAI